MFDELFNDIVDNFFKESEDTINKMRNYKKEREWKKNKYDEIRANIDKELGKELRQKLKDENRSIANWITENAKEYIKTALQ